VAFETLSPDSGQTLAQAWRVRLPLQLRTFS